MSFCEVDFRWQSMIYGKESIKVSILRLVLANYTQYQYKVSFFFEENRNVNVQKNDSSFRQSWTKTRWFDLRSN